VGRRAGGTNIGDMVAVDDRRFVVLERNGGTATTPNTTPFKKVYRSTSKTSTRPAWHARWNWST
jgi:hypothetical protein